MYCDASDVKDKTVNDAIEQGHWVDADIDTRITEGDDLINSALCALGYTPTQLAKSNLVFNLSVKYARYAVLRDTSANAFPVEGAEPFFNKWKTEFDDILAAIEKGEKKLMDDSQTTPVLMNPAGIREDLKIRTNTTHSKRVATMDRPERWGFDNSQHDEEVVGLK